MNSSGQRVSRLPAGHPEGYLEAFVTIYSEVAVCIMARRTGSSIDPAVTFPTIEDGFAGVAMVERGRRSPDGDGAVNAEVTSGLRFPLQRRIGRHELFVE